MLIRNHEVPVDVLDELKEFDWQRERIQGDEFQACSPFREERKPSFYVNTETGLWKDFGASDDSTKQGNLITLLAYLHNVSYEESEEMLLEKYNVIIDNVEGLELNINLQMEQPPLKIFTSKDLKPYLYRKKEYLLSRGVSEEIQKKFVIGYDKTQKAVAFFWFDAFTGKVVNVKFRSTAAKNFFYIRGGQAIRNHVYGLYHVIKEEHKKAYIVESEIDALYLWSNGIPAVALGGSYLSPAQKRKLLLSGVEHFVIATDKDKAGERIKNSLTAELSGHVQLSEITIPDYAGDVNEVKPEDIKKITDSEESITLNMDLRLTV